MTRRASFGFCFALIAASAVASPASAQLARPRTVAPDAPKLLVVPFVRDNQDSALSLVLADGVRERLRSAHLDKFNTITRAQLNQVLTESGFPVDVPLDAQTVRNVVRYLNARYVVEGSMIRRGDSISVIARLSEASGTTPQATTVQVTAPSSRIGTAAGADIANRLVLGAQSFDEVQEAMRRLDQNDIAGAQQKCDQARRQGPNNAGPYLCQARILEARQAPDDSIVAALHMAYERDTLATAVMRRLATKYQARGDTARLLDMLKRILTVDFRDNDLLISTARLQVQMGQADSAVVVLNRALTWNPASAEILGVKAIAMAAGQHFDSALAIMNTINDIDTSKVDSLFVYRVTNYARQIPDSTQWLRWVERATQKFPTQLDYWYTLAIQKMAKNDSAGAEAAAQGLLRNVGAGGDTASATRAYFARANYVLAMMDLGHGNLDSANAHAQRAAQDSTIRPQLAVIYYRMGDRWRADTATVGYLDSAITYFTRAREWGASNARLMVPTNFLLGIVQFQKGQKIDTEAQGERSCEKARAARALMDQAEAGIIAGVATNRELANSFLSQYIPAFKQREDTMIRQYCR